MTAPGAGEGVSWVDVAASAAGLAEQLKAAAAPAASGFAQEFNAQVAASTSGTGRRVGEALGAEVTAGFKGALEELGPAIAARLALPDLGALISRSGSGREAGAKFGAEMGTGMTAGFEQASAGFSSSVREITERAANQIAVAAEKASAGASAAFDKTAVAAERASAAATAAFEKAGLDQQAVAEKQALASAAAWERSGAQAEAIATKSAAAQAAAYANAAAQTADAAEREATRTASVAEKAAAAEVSAVSKAAAAQVLAAEKAAAAQEAAGTKGATAAQAAADKAAASYEALAAKATAAAETAAAAQSAQAEASAVLVEATYERTSAASAAAAAKITADQAAAYEKTALSAEAAAGKIVLAQVSAAEKSAEAWTASAAKAAESWEVVQVAAVEKGAAAATAAKASAAAAARAEAGAAARSEAQQWVDSFGSGMSSGIAPLMSKVVQKFAPALSQFSPMFENVGLDAGQVATKALAEETKKMAPGMEPALEDVKANFSSKMAAAGKAGGELMGLGVAGAVVAAADIVVHVWADAVKKVNETVAEIGQYGFKVADTFMSGLQSVVSGEMPEFKEAINVATEGIGGLMSAPMNMWKASIDDTIGHIPVIGTVAKTMTGEVAAAFSAVGAAFGEATSLAESYIETLTKVGDSWTEVARTISGQVLDTGKLHDYLDVVQNITASGAVVHFKEVGEVVGELAQRLSGLDEGAGLTKEQLQELATTLAEGNELLGGIKINVDNLTAAFNDFGVKADDTNETLITMVNISRLTGANLNEMLTDIDQVGPAMQELGYNITDTTLLMAQMNQQLGDPAMNRMAFGIAQIQENLKKQGISDAKQGMEDIVGSVRDFTAAGQDAAAVDFLKQFVGSARTAETMVAGIKEGAFKTPAELQAFINSQAEALHQPLDEILEQTKSLGDTFEQLGNQAMGSLAPIAIPLMAALREAGNSVSDWIKDNKVKVIEWTAEVGQDILTGVGWVARGVGAMLDTIAPAVQVLKNIVVANMLVMAAAIEPILHVAGFFSDTAKTADEQLQGVTAKLQGLAKTDISTPLQSFGKTLMGFGENEIPKLKGELQEVTDKGVDTAAIGHAFLQTFTDAEGAVHHLDDAFERTKDKGFQILGGPTTIAAVKDQLTQLGITLQTGSDGVVTGVTAKTQAEADAFKEWWRETYGEKADLPGPTPTVGGGVLPTTVQVAPDSADPNAIPNGLGLPSELWKGDHLEIPTQLVTTPDTARPPGTPYGPYTAPAPADSGADAQRQNLLDQAKQAVSGMFSSYITTTPRSVGEITAAAGVPESLTGPRGVVIPTGFDLKKNDDLDAPGLLNNTGIATAYQGNIPHTNIEGVVIPTGFDLRAAESIGPNDLMSDAGIPDDSQGEVGTNSTPGVTIPAGLDVKTSDRKTVGELMESVGIPSENQGADGVTLDVSYNMPNGSGSGGGGGIQVQDAGFSGGGADTGAGGNEGAPPGAGAARWAPVVAQVVAQYGPKLGITDPAIQQEWDNAIVKQIGQESGGDPNIRNDHDSNGRGGTQSVAGLLQYLGSTFQSSAQKLTGITDMMNPIAQIAGALLAPRNPDGSPNTSAPTGIGAGHGWGPSQTYNGPPTAPSVSGDPALPDKPFGFNIGGRVGFTDGGNTDDPEKPWEIPIDPAQKAAWNLLPNYKRNTIPWIKPLPGFAGGGRIGFSSGGSTFYSKSSFRAPPAGPGTINLDKHLAKFSGGGQANDDGGGSWTDWLTNPQDKILRMLFGGDRPDSTPNRDSTGIHGHAAGGHVDCALCNGGRIGFAGGGMADVDGPGSHDVLGHEVDTGTGTTVSDWILAAEKKVGVGQSPSSSRAWIDGLETIASRESGTPNVRGTGRAKATNDYDINAAQNNSSQGLFQLTPTNFHKFHQPGDGPDDINNPISNAAAAIRYLMSPSVNPGKLGAVSSDASNLTKLVEQADINRKPLGYAAGGDVEGRWVPGKDSIPMDLPAGTFVVNRDKSFAHRSLLDKIMRSGSGAAGKSHTMIPSILEVGERLIPPHIAQPNLGLLHSINSGRLGRIGMQGGGALEVIYNDTDTGQEIGEADGKLVGPGTSQPGYYRDDWKDHKGHVHTSFAQGPDGQFYGLPKGTNISYGGGGFPPWVYALGAQFGMQPSTYPGHQESSGFNRGIDWTPINSHGGQDGAGLSKEDREKMKAFAESIAMASSAGQGSAADNAVGSVSRSGAGMDSIFSNAGYGNIEDAGKKGSGGGGGSKSDPGNPQVSAPTTPGSSYEDIPPPPDMPKVPQGTPGSVDTPFGTFQYTQDMPDKGAGMPPEQRGKFDTWLLHAASLNDSAQKDSAAVTAAQTAVDDPALKATQTQAHKVLDDMNASNAAAAAKDPDPAKKLAYLQSLDDYIKAVKAATASDKAISDANQRLIDAKNSAQRNSVQADIEANKPPPWEKNGKGSSDKNSIGNDFGKGIVTGIFQELGFPDVFGKPVSEWGIVKLLEGIGGYGLGLAQNMTKFGDMKMPGGPGGVTGGAENGVLSALGFPTNALPNQDGTQAPGGGGGGGASVSLPDAPNTPQDPTPGPGGPATDSGIAPTSAGGAPTVTDGSGKLSWKHPPGTPGGPPAGSPPPAHPGYQPGSPDRPPPGGYKGLYPPAPVSSPIPLPGQGGSPPPPSGAGGLIAPWLPPGAGPAPASAGPALLPFLPPIGTPNAYPSGFNLGSAKDGGLVVQAAAWNPGGPQPGGAPAPAANTPAGVGSSTPTNVPVGANPGVVGGSSALTVNNTYQGFNPTPQVKDQVSKIAATTSAPAMAGGGGILL